MTSSFYWFFLFATAHCTHTHSLSFVPTILSLSLSDSAKPHIKQQQTSGQTIEITDKEREHKTTRQNTQFDRLLIACFNCCLCSHCVHAAVCVRGCACVCLWVCVYKAMPAYVTQHTERSYRPPYAAIEADWINKLENCIIYDLLLWQLSSSSTITGKSKSTYLYATPRVP